MTPFEQTKRDFEEAERLRPAGTTDLGSLTLAIALNRLIDRLDMASLTNNLTFDPKQLAKPSRYAHRTIDCEAESQQYTPRPPLQPKNSAEPRLLDNTKTPVTHDKEDETP